MISNARIGVKLHKNVTLIRTTDPVWPRSCWPGRLWSLGGGPAVGYGAPGPAGRGGCRDRRASPHGPHAACRARGTESRCLPVAVAVEPEPDRRSSGHAACAHRAAAAEPRLAFRAALSRYKGSRLAAIRLAQGGRAGGTRIRPGRERRRDHRTPRPASRRRGPGREARHRLATGPEPLQPDRDHRRSRWRAWCTPSEILGADADDAILKPARAGITGDRAQCRARPRR